MIEALHSEQETIILVGIVLEVEFGPKATALVRCRSFLSQKLTLVEETRRWPPLTQGVPSYTIPNLFFLLLMVMVGTVLLLPPQLLLQTKLS